MPSSLTIGSIEVHLPSASMAYHSIMLDLAEALDVDENAVALKLFLDAWRQDGPRHRLGADREADYAFLRGGKDAILRAAVLIHELAGWPLGDDEVTRARAALRAHKRPKAKPWKIGDVFAAPLGDGTFIFGQVLAEQYRSPTCALFESRAKSTDVPLEEIVTSRTLAIFHEQPDALDEGRWVVIGSFEPVNEPYGGPCGDPFRVGGISTNQFVATARAYFGLETWNRRPLLLPGIECQKSDET